MCLIFDCSVFPSVTIASHPDSNPCSLLVANDLQGYNDLMAAEEEDTPWEEAKEDSEEEKAAKAKSNQESVDLGREKRAEAAKQVDLKEMATQWAKREYLRKSMKRAVPVKEDAFIEIIWDRAMFEADLKYRTMQGQAVSESEERKKFREDQQKKKEEAYRSEKERWKKMKYSELEEELARMRTPGTFSARCASEGARG